MTQRTTALTVAIVLLGLALPKLLYAPHAIDLVCFALFAVSLDLLFGFVGLLSFGQALFWGGAGYAAEILLARAHVDATIAIAGGVLYALVLAFLVGAAAVRRSGIYFAMITLGVAQIQYFYAFQLVDLTGGENGLLSGRGYFFGHSVDDDLTFYYIVLAIVALGVWFALRLTRSPFGRVLQAMRENEPRAIALGYRVDRYKLAVFTIAGGLAGLAGSLYALGGRQAALEMVDWHTSGAVVMMTILGGIGTIFGPIVGAALFRVLEFVLPTFQNGIPFFGMVIPIPIGQAPNLVMGAIFALCVLLFRRGIVGELLALRPKARGPS